MSFSTDWLSERFRFDSAARNEVLELNCFHYFAYQPKLKIVDVGAGNGANVKYYMDRIPQHQHWICVEQDPALCEAMKPEIHKHGQSLGYVGDWEEGVLLLKGAGHEIKVEVQQASLLDLEPVIDLSAVDLITANAVFDLFSEAQFSEFAAQLARYRLSFLSTLNYTGMNFSPAQTENEQVVNWYEQHMERPQDFGFAMGKKGPDKMVEMLQKLGAQAEDGESNWHIFNQDKVMLSYLLGFMKSAIGELELSEAEKGFLQTWLVNKHTQLAQSELSLEVEHLDILAHF